VSRRVFHVGVSRAALNVEALRARVADDRAGAVATFAGIVRNHHAGKAVSHLEYEAYGSMAESVLRDILAEAADRWELLGAAVVHRVGRLEVGEASVAIAVSSAHRGESFAALRYIIDELKARAPIWKRETGPDGSHWVEGPDLVASSSDGHNCITTE
jgi:molybdopterin synthase catalytic subunit